MDELLALLEVEPTDEDVDELVAVPLLEVAELEEVEEVVTPLLAPDDEEDDDEDDDDEADDVDAALLAPDELLGAGGVAHTSS
ncbi:MAG: hypothetical protein AB2A00_36650 [Myxococcota bacterium]